MRPGSRRNGVAANPIAAATCGAVVSLLLCYALSYFLTCLRLGIVSDHAAWDSRRTFMLAGLNVYACQHVPLTGSGIPPGYDQHIRAFITLPLTLWAMIPVVALVTGGWVCARCRLDAGRRGMVASALLCGAIYAGVLAGLAGVVSARFESTAIPAVSGFELIPPDIEFRPSIGGALAYGLLFGIVFSYLGALPATRSSSETYVRGKWWACAKAVLIVAVVLQLLICGAALGWFAAQAESEGADGLTQPKAVGILPTVTGVGYALLHGAQLSARAVPELMPSQAYSLRFGLYRGIEANDRGKISRKPTSPWIWIAAVIAALAIVATGRLAVKFGSRDGSLPAALRVTLVHSAYLAVTMALCRAGWGIAGQLLVVIGPEYDSDMLVEVACVFLLALVGAHWANRRYAGRLAGFPSV